MPDAKTSFEKEIPERIENDPEKAKAVDAIFLFKITGDDGGEWTVNLKDDLGVKQGDQGNSECTIECTDEHWVEISENPANAMQLYFSGDLKVEGNAMLATKLQEILA